MTTMLGRLVDVEVVDQRAVGGELGQPATCLTNDLAVVAVDLAQGVADVAVVVGERAPRLGVRRRTRRARAPCAPRARRRRPSEAWRAPRPGCAIGGGLRAWRRARSWSRRRWPAWRRSRSAGGLAGGLLGGVDGLAEAGLRRRGRRGGGRASSSAADLGRLRAQDREPGSEEHDGADEEDADGRGDLAHGQSIGSSPPEVESHGV